MAKTSRVRSTLALPVVTLEVTMVETGFVTLLLEAGYKQRRAAAFERWLDDKAYLGITSDSLAASLFHWRDAAIELHCDQMTLFADRNLVIPSYVAHVPPRMPGAR